LQGDIDMTVEAFHTRAQSVAATPVELMTGEQLVDAAAIVVGDINAVTGIRGPGFPKTGVYDHDIAQVLRVVANFPDSHAAAIQRAEHLGYPWTQVAQERNDQVMTTYLASITDVPQQDTFEVIVPEVNLGVRPPFVRDMEPDAEDAHTAELRASHEVLAQELAARILHALPVTVSDPQAVMDLAGQFASERLQVYETAVQYGLDAAAFEQRRALEALQLMGREQQRGTY
jgi:hypothetical protein